MWYRSSVCFAPVRSLRRSTRSFRTRITLDSACPAMPSPIELAKQSANDGALFNVAVLPNREDSNCTDNAISCACAYWSVRLKDRPGERASTVWLRMLGMSKLNSELRAVFEGDNTFGTGDETVPAAVRSCMLGSRAWGSIVLVLDCHVLTVDTTRSFLRTRCAVDDVAWQAVIVFVADTWVKSPW